MKPADAQRFATTLAKVAAAYGRQLDGPAIDGFWLALADLPLEAVEAAALRALVESPRMPTPAELRKLAGAQDTRGLAIAAWAAVAGAVATVGRYQAVDFGDPAVHAAIRGLGGWGSLCGRGGDDFHTWARREFLELYREYTENPPGGGYGDPLPAAGVANPGPPRRISWREPRAELKPAAARRQLTEGGE